MSISVHTNKPALVALQNLNATNDQIGEVQNHINTGLKIANARDNAAVWSIAQNQRADIGALNAVKMSLDRANSIAEVSMTAGQTVSDLLVQLKEKVVAAMVVWGAAPCARGGSGRSGIAMSGRAVRVPR